MAEENAPAILKLLSNDLRWKILSALAHSDLRVQELCALLGQPQNLISYHLQKLSEHKLVTEHPSIADGREVYYGIHLGQVREQYKAAGMRIHPVISSRSKGEFPSIPLRVLFVCTHNSARSQMAEGLLRTRSQNQIQVYSAGTAPTTLNPLAVQAMAEIHVDIRGQLSKGLEQFQGEAYDYIITVCDRARENCPLFPGKPLKLHWSIPDPAAASEPGGDPVQPFRDTADELSERIDYFLAKISTPIQPENL
jgi:ArsR family transcriptional regulator, arsenate/arsenite/antimonite-responsive transcriptional repressor / arsenate reductase (thioredoxin)